MIFLFTINKIDYMQPSYVINQNYKIIDGKTGNYVEKLKPWKVKKRSM